MTDQAEVTKEVEVRFYEVVLTKSVSGVIRISSDMLLDAGEDWEIAVEELAGMDDAWVKGTRSEDIDGVDILDVTATRS